MKNLQKIKDLLGCEKPAETKQFPLAKITKMKYIGITILLFFIIINSFGQEIFHDARFVKIKQIEKGFISIINGANDTELKKFLVEKYDGYYTEGIALHDKEGKFIWVKAFDDRLIFDVKFENNKISVLNADWHNSKVSSSAELYETILDFEGKLLLEEKISYIQSDVPNSRIRGLYDNKGRIWEWVNWERSENISINEIVISGCERSNIRITNHQKDSCYSHIIKGDKLRLLTYDVFKDKIGFLIRGNDISFEHKTFDDFETILVEFMTTGNIKATKPIATDGVFLEHLEIANKGFFVGGTFQGNDSLNFEPTPYLLGKPLNSPKNKFRDETARNGFVAYINDSLCLNWLQIIESEYDVSIESMSVQDTTIIIGIEYKDFVKLSKNELFSLKDSSEYEYSDAALIIFNSKGEMVSFKQLIGNGYEKIGAYLIDNKLILFGDFLYSMNVFDIELKSLSKNSCNYLIFRDKEMIEK